MTLLLNFDSYLTALLRSIVPHSQFFNYFFSFFSLRGNSILVWILVMIMVVILEEKKFPGFSKKDKKFMVIFLLSFLTAAILSVSVFKNLFRRPRPNNFTDSNRFQPIQPIPTCPKDYSFPSAHAATAFAAATALTSFDKKRRWFYYFVSLIISYSRIYLGCHYLFDIIGGSLLGYVISKLILKTIKNYV